MWCVPLLVALVPFVAAHLAYAVSIQAGHVLHATAAVMNKRLLRPRSSVVTPSRWP
jgi:hypothetical protein